MLYNPYQLCKDHSTQFPLLSGCGYDNSNWLPNAVYRCFAPAGECAGTGRIQVFQAVLIRRHFVDP